MKIRLCRPSVAIFACSAVLSLSACDGKLAVIDDLDRQSSDLASDGSSNDSNHPPPGDGCTCASSPSLQALTCGAGEVPLLDNDIVQLTPDGSVAAFNVDTINNEYVDDYQLYLWDAGAGARPVANGMLIGLSASGERVLFAGGAGLVLIDLNGTTQAFALDMIVGRGSLSAAGDSIIGASYPENVAQLVRANADTGATEVLGDMGNNISRAYTTPDASIIVGVTSFGSDPSLDSQRGFVYDADGLSFGLPGAPEGVTVWPEAVNPAGTVIAGRSLPRQSHFRWTEAGGFVEIAAASGRSETQLSVDGSVVLGSLDPEGDDDSAAFRWTEATGAVDLTPGTASLATDMSNDGNVIVATSWEDAQINGAFPEDTFVWDPDHGTRTLDELLEDRGVDASGWEFGHARALSEDGKVLLGRARCGGVPALYRIVLSD